MLLDTRSRITASPTEAVIAAAGQVILGKERQIRLAMACILARGHLLIEDVPGVGKTTLAAALARSIGGGFQRIQFTSDMLPSDILGVTVYQPDRNDFVFKPGLSKLDPEQFEADLRAFANKILTDLLPKLGRAAPAVPPAPVSKARPSLPSIKPVAKS